jgi:hypothetical protein
MKTYEVMLRIEYVKRYIANSPKEAMDALEFDYVNGYIAEEMAEENMPKIYSYAWDIDYPKQVKNDKTIYAYDAREV